MTPVASPISPMAWAYISRLDRFFKERPALSRLISTPLRKAAASPIRVLTPCMPRVTGAMPMVLYANGASRMEETATPIGRAHLPTKVSWRCHRPRTFDCGRGAGG